MKRRTGFVLLALAGVLPAIMQAQAQVSRPIFKTGIELVSISASVKRGNVPVSGLAAADFALFDEEVPQAIEALTLERVPLDVTLFMDTSHSTAGVQNRMRRDVEQMMAMLAPEDRVRLLTIGLSVQMPVPWRPGGKSDVPTLPSLPGISLIYDTLTVALAHVPAPDRRHLIVAMTDGEDCGSIADGPQVLEMSGRTESVLHWVRVRSQGGMLPHGVPAWCTPMDGLQTDYVSQAARRSGGDGHSGFLDVGDPTVDVFRDLLNDFRHSYVLRYTPAGVRTGGWHRVRVTVPGHPDYKLQFRAGYYAAP